MILLRKPRPKILYLHGKDEEIKYPDGGRIYNTLRKYFDIDYAKLSTEPVQRWKDFEDLDFSRYSAVLGFSIGGVYASCQDKIPAILLNPGYGLSQAFPEYKKLDTTWKKVDHSGILKIFLSEKDKYSVGYLPEIKKAGLEDKIQWIPSQKHVPTEEEIKKYLVPGIKKLI